MFSLCIPYWQYSERCISCGFNVTYHRKTSTSNKEPHVPTDKNLHLRAPATPDSGPTRGECPKPKYNDKETFVKYVIPLSIILNVILWLRMKYELYIIFFLSNALIKISTIYHIMKSNIASSFLYVKTSIGGSLTSAY